MAIFNSYVSHSQRVSITHPYYIYSLEITYPYPYSPHYLSIKYPLILSIFIHYSSIICLIIHLYLLLHIYISIISINNIYSLEITYPLLIHMSYPFCIAILTLVAFPSSSKTRNPWEQPKPGEMVA